MGDFLEPIMDGVGTFSSAIITNPTMLSIIGVIVACGIGAFAFSTIKRFIKR